jgi:response regulator aspartate phosphatase F
MTVSVRGNEQITNLLNEWYVEIRSRHIAGAHRLKKDIDAKINDIEEDQNLLIYYSLLDFRHNYLINNLGLSHNSFDKIDSLGEPTDNFLSYYYHFFKAIHANEIGKYNIAREHYDKAESLIEYVPDALIERAELHYKLATFNYDVCRFLLSVNHAKQAKDIYAQHNGYEANIALCENIMGMSCIELKEWELAEEHLLSATSMFKQLYEEKFTYMTRNNLGLMYASQNLSDLAIRYLSEVIEYNSQHYKAIYI